LEGGGKGLGKDRGREGRGYMYHGDLEITRRNCERNADGLGRRRREKEKEETNKIDDENG